MSKKLSLEYKVPPLGYVATKSSIDVLQSNIKERFCKKLFKNFNNVNN